MDIKTYKGKSTGAQIDDAVVKVGTLGTDVSTLKSDVTKIKSDASDVASDVARLNETMGVYSDRPNITLAPKETGVAISADGVKVSKSGWAIAEFTAEKGNVYLFKPGATDGNVCVFAEYISTVETRGIDYTYTYNDDGTIATAKATYGGKTHTYTYTYTDGQPTIKEGETVIDTLPMTYTTSVGGYSPLVKLNVDAELPKDGYCRYMSHFKGNSSIKVVVSYKVGAADLTMKVTRDGVFASISTQLGNLSQKIDTVAGEVNPTGLTVRLHTTVDCSVYLNGKATALEGKKSATFRGLTSFATGLNDEERKTNAKYINHIELSGTPVGGLSDVCKRCVNLKSIDVRNLDTSKVTDMGYMFSDCGSLASLDVSGWDVSKVTNMIYMFNGCSSLTSLDVSGWDVSKVTEASCMFQNCSLLTSVDVSGWDVSKATNMTQIFFGCSSLTSLDVSGWDTGSVTIMYAMFFGCSSLASLDVSGWDVSKATSMGSMFSGCAALASLDVSGWDVSKVTSMGYMFNGCSSLASLDVSGWNTGSVTNMAVMLFGCKSLTSLDVSGWDTSEVTSMHAIFNGCYALTTLKLGEGFGKMKDAVGTLDLSSLTKWTDESVQTLLSLYDRAANGLGVITIKLSAQTKAVLGESGITALTAKGYTIA